MPSFQALVEYSSDMIALVNESGQMLYVSPSSTKVLGYQPDELVGGNLLNLIHPDELFLFRKTVRADLAPPPALHQIETRLCHKDGHWRWVEVTLSNLLAEPRVAAIIANCREISTRRAELDQKQQDSEALARSNVELEHFAYSVAHDLREPLRTISMFTEVLTAEVKLDPEGKQIAQYIVDGVARVSSLFEGLRAFAVRSFDALPQPIDLKPLADEALRNLEHAIRTSGATVTVHALPWVRGDRQLLRVFQNLIGNAIKYRGNSPPVVRIDAERLGPDWIVRVRDNGVGIAPEHHERIFRLLKRLHGVEKPGDGFGLAICKKLVESLGGRIWVEAEPGVGSTFCFSIAALEQPSEDPTLATADRFGNRHADNTMVQVPLNALRVAVGAP